MTEVGVTEDLVEKAAAALYGANWALPQPQAHLKDASRDKARAVLAAVVPEVRRQVAEEWLAEMAIEQSDPRLNYTTVQISHAAWDEMNAAREIGGVDQ